MTSQNWYSVEQAGLRNISHDFTPDQIAALIVPHLSEEEWKQAALAAVQAEVDAMYRELDAFLDNLDKLPPRKMRERFLLHLITDHQGDIEAASVEYDWLMRRDYVNAVKAGKAPPPVARPWATLILMPHIFYRVQATFRQVMTQYEREAGYVRA